MLHFILVSPETESPTRAISSAEGGGKAVAEGTTSKHEHVSASLESLCYTSLLYHQTQHLLPELYHQLRVAVKL